MCSCADRRLHEGAEMNMVLDASLEPSPLSLTISSPHMINLPPPPPPPPPQA